MQLRDMAEDELGHEVRDRYAKWTCCKMYCPPWDCEELIVVDQVADGVVFIQKPNKFMLYLCSCSCLGLWCLRRWFSIQVHSVEENGDLKISHHAFCEDWTEKYDDVVGVNEVNMYVASNGAYRTSCRGKDAKQTVNEYLTERRESEFVFGVFITMMDVTVSSLV
eukprot:gb/GECG01006311.1/.p1 GENE.gb/GECG01006311.1/~~gb/GECG01006311.1/.p1  ORF type:complete len:165 (+),score=19.83 gb/GECG01006311.1/:1-495(+)